MSPNATAKNNTLSIQGEAIVLRHVDFFRYTQGWQTPQFSEPPSRSNPTHFPMDACIVSIQGVALLAHGNYLREAPLCLKAGTDEMHWILSGPRVGIKKRFHSPRWSESAYVQSVPISMESCMGGTSLGKPHPLNPKGKGFVITHDPRLLIGIELPQLEFQDAQLNRKRWIVPAAHYPHNLPTPALPSFELLPDTPWANLTFRLYGGHAHGQEQVWSMPEEMPLGLLAEDNHYRECPMKPVAIDFHLSGGVVRVVFEARFTIDDPTALPHTKLRGGLAP